MKLVAKKKNEEIEALKAEMEEIKSKMRVLEGSVADVNTQLGAECEMVNYNTQLIDKAITDIRQQDLPNITHQVYSLMDKGETVERKVHDTAQTLNDISNKLSSDEVNIEALKKKMENVYSKMIRVEVEADEKIEAVRQQSVKEMTFLGVLTGAMLGVCLVALILWAVGIA